MKNSETVGETRIGNFKNLVKENLSDLTFKFNIWLTMLKILGVIEFVGLLKTQNIYYFSSPVISMFAWETNF